MTFLNAGRKLSSDFVLALLFLTFLAFRIYFNSGMLSMDHTENIFRVGVVPWSDAKAWTDGAIQVLNGEQITGVATARPLYSLFLTALFFLVGSSYTVAIYGQMAISALALLAAYYLLKPIPDRIGVLLFMSFLVVWRPEVSTVFMTENLGIYILILSFTMFWRGFYLECDKTALAGTFLLGLSQAVRPWCVMSLVTVPLICFVSRKPIIAKFKSFVLHVLLISIGFGFHTLGTGLFNKSGESYANNPQTLYGQVAGGRGWTAVYKDPIIKKALEENRTANEVNKIIYQRIKELLRENPGNFLKAIISSYKYYFMKIPDEFGSAKRNPIYFTLFFLLLALLDKRSDPNRFFHALKNRPMGLLILILVLILFYLKYNWFWTLLSLVGIFHLVFSRRDKFNTVLLLFLAGILLSLPLVGKDGGLRVRIGSDIMLYLVAALGLCRLLRDTRFISPHSSTASDVPIYNIRTYHFMGIVLGTMTLLLAVPYFITISHRRPAEHTVLENLGAKDIATRLDLDQAPLDPEKLRARWHTWPEASFEDYDGRLAFYPIRYTHQDAVFFDINDGLSRMHPFSAAKHWPLFPMNIRRTVMILETWYTLFPNISPDILSRFENKRILVIGNLLVNPRPFRHATPFVLIVSHIASTDESGKLMVTKLYPIKTVTMKLITGDAP